MLVTFYSEFAKCIFCTLNMLSLAFQFFSRNTKTKQRNWQTLKFFSCKIKSVLKYNNKRCLPKIFQLKSFRIWCQILLLFLLSFSLNSAIINSLTRDFQVLMKGGSHDDEASSRKNERPFWCRNNIQSEILY